MTILAVGGQIHSGVAEVSKDVGMQMINPFNDGTKPSNSQAR